MEGNIVTSIISSIPDLKDECLNLKDIIIKKLQERKQELQSKLNKLEENIFHLEKELNALNQYGRGNNLVLSGIPENLLDNRLETTVTSILSDIDLTVCSNVVEDCHRFGKLDKNTKSDKSILRLVKRKFFEKALLDSQNLSNLNNSKYQFHSWTKVFINESLTHTNKLITYEAWNLKRN